MSVIVSKDEIFLMARPAEEHNGEYWVRISKKTKQQSEDNRKLRFTHFKATDMVLYSHSII